MLSRLNRVVRVPARERISDRVHRELASAIRDLRLTPGTLLSETDLSLQLGVSRTPLREAISRLVDQGLLTVASQVGTTVALIDLADVEEACFIRRALEIAAFQDACQSPNRDVVQLHQILKRQEKAMDEEDVEAFFVTDEELHQEIFRVGGHPGVWNVVRRSKLQLDRLRRLILPSAITTRDLIDEHVRIVDLVETANIEAGVRLIAEHSLHVLTQAPDVRAIHPDYFTS